MDAGEEDLGLGAEEGSEDYGMDMTGASDEDVISVYKKLSGDDEIEVVSSNEVNIKDPISGAEYNVKMGGSAIDKGEMSLGGDLEVEPEIGPEMELDMGTEPEEEMDLEMGTEPEEEMDLEIDDEADSEMGGEDEDDSEMGGDDEDEDDEDDLGESVVYEIELSDDEEIVEDIIRTKGHDKELTNTSAPNTGDIEGQKASEDSDSGDNLSGGFDDKGKNGSGDAHANHIMEDEDEEPIEEKIQVGKARNVTNNKTDIKGAGGKANNVKAPNVTVSEVAKKYNKLLSEAKELKTENDMFRTSLKGFRKTITETAIFNINLTHATKLFLEHSTTSKEKESILNRFDDEVGTIEESKKLYKRINSELGNKSTNTRSIDNKLVSEQSSGQSAQLNETTAYVDPAQKRVLDLIRRTK